MIVAKQKTVFLIPGRLCEHETREEAWRALAWQKVRAACKCSGASWSYCKYHSPWRGRSRVFYGSIVAERLTRLYLHCDKKRTSISPNQRVADSWPRR